MALYAGTASGVFLLKNGHPRLVGLPKQIITHLAVGQSFVGAAVPARGPVHDMTSLPSASEQLPGLHVASISGDAQHEDLGWRRVWEGDARAVALSDAAGAWFVGELLPPRVV
jgi:hypothetical protein